MILDNTSAFESSSKTVICNKIYIVERHFTGKRNFTEAIYTAIKNDASREKTAVKTA